MSDNCENGGENEVNAGIGYTLDGYTFFPTRLAEEALCGICHGFIEEATNACSGGHQLCIDFDKHYIHFLLLCLISFNMKYKYIHIYIYL